MLDQKQLISALNQISEEKGIPKERVIETIEMALAAAYKKDYGKKSQIIRAKFDPETGKMAFFQIKLVVDESMLKPEETEEEEAKKELKEIEEKEEEKKKEPSEAAKEAKETEEMPETEEEKKIRFNPERHIMLEEAIKIDQNLKVKDELIIPLETREEYGRIASQTAKQVILQRLREAERDAILKEYKAKEGEILSGLVQRMEGRTVYFDLGKATGAIYPYEQIPGEYYQIGERLKVYLLSVELTPKGPLLLLSRSHPKFVSRLFELEVPEIPEGIIDVKLIAREPGSRTKIAVGSTQEGVDPIGSCVGQKGTRVSAVINELGGEKIDIIEWSDDPIKFITNALLPAKVTEVILKKGRKEAKVMVPENQLSLAIGKQGQNVRLAAKLTGWKLDIRSVQKPEEKIEIAEAEEKETVEKIVEN